MQHERQQNFQQSNGAELRMPIAFLVLDHIIATIHMPISNLQSKCKINRRSILDAYTLPFSFPIEPCSPRTQKRSGPKRFTHDYDLGLGLLNCSFLPCQQDLIRWGDDPVIGSVLSLGVMCVATYTWIFQGVLNG